MTEIGNFALQSKRNPINKLVSCCCFGIFMIFDKSDQILGHNTFVNNFQTGMLQSITKCSQCWNSISLRTIPQCSAPRKDRSNWIG